MPGLTALFKLKDHRPSRFLAVGAFNTIIDFSLLNVLVFGAGINKIVANSASTTTTMLLSYLLNHRFVFGSKRPKQFRQLMLFVAITAFGLLIIQNGLIHVLYHQFDVVADAIFRLIQPVTGSAVSQSFIRLNGAKVIATIVTIVWNYELYKRVVFRPR